MRPASVRLRGYPSNQGYVATPGNAYESENRYQSVNWQTHMSGAAHALEADDRPFRELAAYRAKALLVATRVRVTVVDDDE